MIFLVKNHHFLMPLMLDKIHDFPRNVLIRPEMFDPGSTDAAYASEGVATASAGLSVGRSNWGQNIEPLIMNGGSWWWLWWFSQETWRYHEDMIEMVGYIWIYHQYRDGIWGKNIRNYQLLWGEKGTRLNWPNAQWFLFPKNVQTSNVGTVGSLTLW